MIYLGVDLGTSAVKILAVDEKGNIIKTVSEEYPVCYPHPGWSEQAPEDWWDAVKKGIKAITACIDRSQIAGIGCAGQMHGLVILDKNDEVIRPAILWNDGRTAKETDYLNEVIGKETLSDETANIAFAGFTAPKILWVKKNEPENFSRISKIMLPKDYIVYKLTGVFSSDYSDFSGTLLLDVKNRKISKKMCEICCVREEQLPRLYESYEKVGAVKNETAAELGLNENTTVVAGAGDNAAAAIGTGTVGEGRCNISLGTSGTLFISSTRFGVDSNNALHSFCHADGNYHLMGCMLSAASCNKWFMEDILHDNDYTAAQKLISDGLLGSNHTFFLPYLMGERSPINDTNARGTFTGMTSATTREEMLLAVLEGVAFAIRDSLEVARSLGNDIKSSTICGGGSKSKLWKQIVANILNVRLETPVTEQGPGYGGAVLAMTACGEYENVKKAAECLVSYSEVIEPDPKLVDCYNLRYSEFSKIYPAMKSLFSQLI